jgi:membrane associated rhomboid family serine protease
MGILDRDYYREEAPRRLWGSSGWGATGLLVALHVGCFLGLALMSSSPWPNLLRLDAERVLEGQLWRLLTYIFVEHPAQLLSFVFNVLFLWWFGRELEQLYGPWEFLGLYFLATVLGAAGGTAVASAAGVPMHLDGPSSPILAVLVTYALWYPRQRVYFYGLLPIEIRWLVALYIGADLLALSAGGRGSFVGEVAVRFIAAAYGAAFKVWDLRLSRWRQRCPGRLRSWRSLRAWRRRTGQLPSVEALEAEIDRLLDKVRQHGLDGLTEEERSRLREASELLKLRRRS